MKKAVILNLVAMLSLSVNAATYECRLSNGSNHDPEAVTYRFDSSIEDNKFVDLGSGVSVGCVVLRTAPPLITCGLGDEVNFSIFVTAEDGTSILALDSNSNGAKSSLKCIKQH